jgi:hypothetical protein
MVTKKEKHNLLELYKDIGVGSLVKLELTEAEVFGGRSQKFLKSIDADNLETYEKGPEYYGEKVYLVPVIIKSIKAKTHNIEIEYFLHQKNNLFQYIDNASIYEDYYDKSIYRTLKAPVVISTSYLKKELEFDFEQLKLRRK